MAKRLLGVVVFGWLAVFLSGECTAQQPRHLLTAADIADLEAYKGKSHSNLLWSEPAGKSLGRVFADIAGKRGGRYSGNNWSVLQTLEAFLFGPPDEIIGVQDRFLVGGGCRAHSCDEKAKFIVDTRTGHVAFALLHSFTVDRRYLEGGAAVTQFMKTCVNPELRAFAAGYLAAWAKKLLADEHPPQTLVEAESKTLTTRC